MCPRSLYNREDCGVGGCLSRVGNHLGPELAEIKSEQALVEANRELVERFERRWCMNRNWPATNPTHRSITYQERTTMAYRARPSG